MQIRAGYEIVFDCPNPTPMVLMLSIHPSRISSLRTPHRIVFDRPAAASDYRDGFDNICTRIVAPAGRLTISSDFIIGDGGAPDPVVLDARQDAVEDLPSRVLAYLLGSRYCETDHLSNIAWSLFGNTLPGWARVQAICDFVHNHLAFGYQHARPTKTAWEAYNERQGVCRDFAHLAITFCRCMNIPARYCTGYLGDIGIPPVDAPMDFSGWFEAYLNGRWYTFDARHNTPRIGRIPMAYGRDATDVAITTTFGPNTLISFKVVTDEVQETAAPTARPGVAAQLESVGR
ncbi:MAG: transglutaminase [Rhodospirillales bacterium]|jgi:transglutaminase-like putative cysteine protease|nr:transglutaminase [Rhodospirillales bacterium]